MRKSIVLPLLATAVVSFAQAPITSNPIPEPIVKKGLGRRGQGPGPPARYARDFGPPIRTFRRPTGRA